MRVCLKEDEAGKFPDDALYSKEVFGICKPIFGSET